MKCNLDSAEIILKWQSGRAVRLGTLKFDVDSGAIKQNKCKHITQKLGWEMIVKGIYLMIRAPKWRLKDDWK